MCVCQKTQINKGRGGGVEKAPPSVFMIKICSQLKIENQRGVFSPKKLWKLGQKITVGFLDGTIEDWERVVRIAKEWEACGNFSFVEELPEKSVVRVSFEGVGSWSFVGTDALSIRTGPTINFGWLAGETSEFEWRRVVLHEFGHVLGLEHEHKHSSYSFLDRQKAIEFLRKQGWDDEKIGQNLFNNEGLEETEFDIDSVMLYRFGDGVGVDSISTGDCLTIGKMYPNLKDFGRSKIAY